MIGVLSSFPKPEGRIPTNQEIAKSLNNMELAIFERDVYTADGKLVVALALQPRDGKNETIILQFDQDHEHFTRFYTVRKGNDLTLKYVESPATYAGRTELLVEDYLVFRKSR